MKGAVAKRVAQDNLYFIGDSEKRRPEAVTVTAAEFQRNLGKYQDVALTRPVAITKNGRERTMLISADEYDRLKRRDREVLLPGDLTDEEIEAIRNAKMPEKYDYLNDELKDWKP